MRRIAVNAHHLADQVGAYVRSVLVERYPGIDWLVSLESELLGTGGGLAKLRGWLGVAPFYVVNADAVFAEDLRGLQGPIVSGAADAVWMVTRDRAYAAIRTVARSEAAYVTDVGSRARPDGVTFCGVHLVTSGLLDRLPHGPSCVVRQGYVPWMAQGARIATHETAVFWADTGTPERYVNAHHGALAYEDTWRRLGLLSPLGQ